MRGFANFGDPRLPERFWSKVAPCPMSGCWLWTAATFTKGYAQFAAPRQSDGTRPIPFAGHRLAFETLVGPVEQGLQIDHLCRVRCCVNPAHLESVTASVNMKRSTAGAVRQRLASLITHCPAGHEYTPCNTLFGVAIGRHRYRRCRICKNKGNREYAAGRRLAERTADVR